MTNVRNGSRTVAIEVFFSFKFAVIFDFNLFPVPPSKATIGDGNTNKQNRGNKVYAFVLSFITRIIY